jgi:hypothetical protein
MPFTRVFFQAHNMRPLCQAFPDVRLDCYANYVLVFIQNA